MSALFMHADDVTEMQSIHGNTHYLQITALEITCTKNALHVLKTLLPVAAPSHAASCAPVVNICVLNQDLIGGEEAGVAWHGEWRVACLNL